MGIFGKRRKLNSAAVAPSLPREGPVIHNHAPGAGVQAFVRYVLMPIITVPTMGALVWFGLVYIVGQAGYSHPARVLAQAIIALVLFIPAVAAAGWAIGWVVSLVADAKVELAKVESATQKSLALTAGKPVTESHRLSDGDREFVRLLKAVMLDAYRHLDEVGEYAGTARPWSKGGAGRFTAPPYSINVTEKQRLAVRGWLVSHGAVRGNQINTDAGRGGFPTFADFEQMVDRSFVYPVAIVTSPSLSD